MNKKTSKSKVIVSLMAPEAKAVLLAGDFTSWEQAPVALKKLKSGLWKATVPLAPGTYFLKAIGSKGEESMVKTFVRK